MVITTAQFHLTMPEFRFSAGSNLARGVSEICNGETGQKSRLEIRLKLFVGQPFHKDNSSSSSSSGNFIFQYRPPLLCSKEEQRNKFPCATSLLTLKQIHHGNTHNFNIQLGGGDYTPFKLSVSRQALSSKAQ